MEGETLLSHRLEVPYAAGIIYMSRYIRHGGGGLGMERGTEAMRLIAETLAGGNGSEPVGKGGTGPGRSHREGITLMDVIRMFPDDATAQKWFEDTVWVNGCRCGRCGGARTTPAKHPTMPYWCLDCRKYFSVKFGTVMERSKLGYQAWAVATYLVCTNVKGISSMKLHRELGITQKSAWFMLHRIRTAFGAHAHPDDMAGPVEYDEKWVGGKEGNKHESKKGKGKKGIVAGARDRVTGQVSAKTVPETTAARLGNFVGTTAKPWAAKYTDENPAYKHLKRHQTVNHSAGEYVRGDVHVNGVESFWALLQRGFVGIYHKTSLKHLHRYVNEFAGRLNMRVRDTADMMAMTVQGMVGRRLTYRMLTKSHGANLTLGAFG